MENLKPHILIIDDEKGLRVGTHRLLESEGYFVESAENGTEGIRLGTSKDFDIAVIDLKMPDIDGLEVLQEIKSKKPNTVCFIATAFASIETAIESTRLGAFSYIPKPFTPEELLYQLGKGYKQRKLLVEADRLRKEKEDNLLTIASEKSRLKTILESIRDGVLVVNKLGEVVYYNHAVLKLLDIPELVIGKKVLDILPSAVTDLINKYIKSDKPILRSSATQIELKPENQLFVEARCSPVLHENERFAGVVVVINNITGFKKIELIKSQFVSMVAHELKAPVAAVLGFLRLILDKSIKTTKEQEDDYLERSSTRLVGLLDLVNDLLDISRMEIKTKQRDIGKLDVAALINNTIDFMELELKGKGIVVQKEIEQDLPPLRADQNEITRLITNILSNAIKYNKENGKILISVLKSQNYLVIKIADSGIGLRPEEKDRLFNEFFRAKNKYTKHVSGTGLGLTIVKRIVDSYHGKIDVESEYEVGTTFTIFLPINSQLNY